MFCYKCCADEHAQTHVGQVDEDWITGPATQQAEMIHMPSTRSQSMLRTVFPVQHPEFTKAFAVIPKHTNTYYY
jgi:hypothetical protein